jgi:hypothetical protein
MSSSLLVDDTRTRTNLNEKESNVNKLFSKRQGESKPPTSRSKMPVDSNLLSLNRADTKIEMAFSGSNDTNKNVINNNKMNRMLSHDAKIARAFSKLNKYDDEDFNEQLDKDIKNKSRHGQRDKSTSSISFYKTKQIINNSLANKSVVGFNKQNIGIFFLVKK